jgi:hypothetical protein
MLRRALAMSVTALTLGATLAVAQPAAEPTSNMDPRAGIEKAKAAGMQIDPAAEELMAQAPPGSCANDPTQETCPPADRFVRVDRVPERMTSSEFAGWANAARAGATKSRVVKNPRARAAQMPWERCSWYGTDPYKEGGVMKGDAGAQCWGGDILRMELYSVLQKQYEGTWYGMDTDLDAVNGPGTTIANARYTCVNTAYRYWRHQIELYVNHFGTWYAASHRFYRWRYCG